MLLGLGLPTVAFYAYFFIGPLGSTVFYSFFEWNAISAKKFVVVDNYIRLFQDPVFYTALRNTLYLAFLTLAVLIPLSFILAYLLYLQAKGHSFFRTLYFVPVVISTVSVSLIFSFIYEPNFGILNTLLRDIGLPDWTRAWLSDKSTAMTAVSIPFIWQHIGLMMIILLAGMQGIAEETLEAAEIDGVNAWQKVWHIVIPSIKEVLQVAVILSITYAFKIFDHILLLTQGGPIHRTEVTGTYMYIEGFRNLKYGYGSTIAVTIMALALLLSYLVKRVSGGSADRM